MNNLKCGICKQQGVRIGKTYIFSSEDAESAGYEQGILSTVQHSRKIIDCGIRIRASDTLDES